MSTTQTRDGHLVDLSPREREVYRRALTDVLLDCNAAWNRFGDLPRAGVSAVRKDIERRLERL